MGAIEYRDALLRACEHIATFNDGQQYCPYAKESIGKCTHPRLNTQTCPDRIEQGKKCWVAYFMNGDGKDYG